MYPVKLLDKASKVEVSQCLDLLNTSFKGSLDYFHWKHNLNEDFEIEEYTFCIFKDNLCIATLQVVIHHMLVLGSVKRFALLSDGATHRDYRRLGLFEKLLSHVNEFCANKNVSFIYGSGNKKSRKAFYKLGFVDFFSTQKATKKIRYNHPALKFYNYVLNGYRQLTHKTFSNIKAITIEDYVLFANSQENRHSISYKKTEAYLNWRLADPTGEYKIYGAFDTHDILSGIIVVKNSKDLLYIVDALFNNEINYLNQLMQFVSGLAIKDKNITRINSIHNNFKRIQEVFIKNKFIVTEEGASALLCPLSPNFKIAQSDLDGMHYMRIDKNE